MKKHQLPLSKRHESVQVVTNEKNVLQMSQKYDNKAEISSIEICHPEYNEKEK